MGMVFFHSLPVPELWDWIFFIPFPFPNNGNGIFPFPSRCRTPKCHSRSPLLPTSELKVKALKMNQAVWSPMKKDFWRRRGYRKGGQGVVLMEMKIIWELKASKEIQCQLISQNFYSKIYFCDPIRLSVSFSYTSHTRSCSTWMYKALKAPPPLRERWRCQDGVFVRRKHPQAQDLVSSSQLHHVCKWETQKLIKK